MFLTTHSVFEQLLLYDHRTSESADRGGRTTAERNTVPGSSAWVGPARRRCSRPSAQRAHRHTGSLRACVRCVARVLGVVRAARRAAASAVVPSADVARAPCRVGAAES
jgi:hypothetical protein